MANFFTAAELATQLQLDSVDTATASQYADLASGIIRDYLHQSIDRKRADVYQAYGDGSELFLLPELPVTAVSAVSVGGVLLSSAEYAWMPRGQVYRTVVAGTDVAAWMGSWPIGVIVSVTYDHGYTAVPSTIKGVALEIAGSVYSNGGGAGILQETIAGYSVTYARSSAMAAGSMSLTDDQKLRLRPYRAVNL